jgi:hypothetical protein
MMMRITVTMCDNANDGNCQRLQAIAFQKVQRFHVSYLQLGSACAVQTQRLDRLAWPAMDGGSTVETVEKLPKKVQLGASCHKNVQKNLSKAGLPPAPPPAQFPRLNAFFHNATAMERESPFCLSEFGCGDPSAVMSTSSRQPRQA